MTADDLQEIFQDASPHDWVPILQDGHLELVAGPRAAEDTEGVSYEWHDGNRWRMRGAASSLGQFLDAVVEPAIRRGAQLAQRER